MNGRNLVDLQLSTYLFKRKGEIKPHISNLLEEETLFHSNSSAYTGMGSTASEFIRNNGTDAYEKDKGDKIPYKVKNERTDSLTFSY